MYWLIRYDKRKADTPPILTTTEFNKRRKEYEKINIRRNTKES
jgi:hypothetical protein